MNALQQEQTETKEQCIAGAISRLMHAENEMDDIVIADKPIRDIRVRLSRNAAGEWVAHASGKLTITLTS